MAEHQENLGGGSGGGESPDHSAMATATYQIQANQVELISQPPLPPAVPEPCVVTVIAAGEPGDGVVDVRGTQGVRITAGPLEDPPTWSVTTDGVEIEVADEQMITLQRGEPEEQMVVMTPEGITVSSGEAELSLTEEGATMSCGGAEVTISDTGQITISSLTEITLSVAGGTSTITLGPEGVQIKGILVQIN